MHRQIAAFVSVGGSPGKLALFGNALGAADLDIETIGGAEWQHNGVLGLILRNDDRAGMDRFEGVCHEHHVPWLSFANVAVELDDRPGSLGAAADAVGDINIYSVLVRKPHGNRAVVELGFRPSEADEAVARLKAAGFGAEKKQHPDEPDAGQEWDERTERLLPLWEDDSVAVDDPRFWQRP